MEADIISHHCVDTPHQSNRIDHWSFPHLLLLTHLLEITNSIETTTTNTDYLYHDHQTHEPDINQ